MNSEVVEESEIVSREKQIFAEMPIIKAVAIMVIPTIISQIITVIYNLADTWFVGLTNNAAAVAAISLCLPVYNIMTAIANLFGIGGLVSLHVQWQQGIIIGQNVLSPYLLEEPFLQPQRIQFYLLY